MMYGCVTLCVRQVNINLVNIKISLTCKISERSKGGKAVTAEVLEQRGRGWVTFFAA